MTSPEKKPSNNSVISEDSLDTANHPDKQDGVIEDAAIEDAVTNRSILENDIEATDDLDRLENHDENKFGEDNQFGEDDEFGKDTLGAQPPESKVIIESLSDDIAVASLEPSDIDSSEAESDAPNVDTQTSTDSSLSEMISKPNHTDSINKTSENIESTEPTSQEDADAEVTVEADDVDHLEGQGEADTQLHEIPVGISQIPERNTQTNKPANALKDSQKKETVENTLDQESADSEQDNAEQNSAEQEEDVKEQKEAKLESYKQFVAEQFSNQKVDYPEVRVRIEANALPSRMYFIMNILSAIIASYGLVTNSAAVVIGAMLVAMMLGPITGVALAIIDYRMPLLRRSLITMLVGVSLVIFVGFIVGWLHKGQPLTAEILSRTQPTSMDLMIALAGGTAGAYAMVSPHLSVAVVGVAVATALVPPLAASGILFANGELQLGLGAFLLAITNIIAIQFTNALVLWLLGFRRLVDDDYKSNTYLTFLRRNAVTLGLLGILGAYLSINLQTNAKQQRFESSVKESINSYFIDEGNVLTNTQFDTVDEHQVVRAVIRGETTPSSYDVRQIESIITQDMAENYPNYLPIKLQLRYFPVQVIESNPLIQDKLDETDAAILTN